MTKFIGLDPFPLELDTLSQQKDVERYAVEQLSSHRGIRNYNHVARYIATSFQWLENDGWETILGKLGPLIGDDVSPQTEREVAKYLVDEENLKGLGPKQARNLLQMMGLTRYEIPIDSRIMKWLNDVFKYPIILNPKGLSDEHYYEFVSDGIQILSKKTGIYPCELDAAIFANSDGNGWDDYKW